MPWTLLGSDLPDPISVDDNGSSLSIDDNGTTLSVDDGGASLTVDGTVATTGTYVEATGSASANSTDLVASTDARTYKAFSVQLTGTFSATVAVQGSNDGTTWINLNLQSSGSATPTVANTMTTTGHYYGAVTTKFVRVRTTTYSSGTVNAILLLTTQPHPSSAVLASFTGQPGVTIYTSDGTAIAATTADSRSSAGTPGVGPYIFNGSALDRLRSVAAVHLTSGTGLAAAGLVGYNGVGGASYQRVTVDGYGALLPVGLDRTTFSGITAVGNLVGSKGVQHYNSLNAVVTNTSATASYVQIQISEDTSTWYPAPLSTARLLDGLDTPLVATANGYPVTSTTAITITAPVTAPNVRLRLVTYGGAGGLSGWLAYGGQPALLPRANPQTATTSNVASSATSVTLLAANPNRRGAVIYNDSTAVLYVKFGTTAANTSFTYLVAANTVLELPALTYAGRIDGIWASANGNARITELTN